MGRGLWSGLLVAALLLPFALGGPTAQAAILESNILRTFEVKPGGQLVVDSDRGSIEITTGDRENVEVSIQRKVKGETQARAAEIFGAHEIEFEQKGDAVAVRAKMTKQFRHGWLGRSPDFQVEFKVAVPARFNLDLKTAGGGISTEDIEGAVKARSSGGGLKFATIKGTLDAVTSAGSIHLEAATGKVYAKSSGGGLDLKKLGGDTVADTSAGGIHLGECSGRLDARTSGGGIEADVLAGPSKLHTSAGSIRVRSAQAPADLDTSGGGITVDEARDAIRADTSAGSIRVNFTAQPREDCRLTSSAGGIDITLAPTLGFDLDAHTSAGSVHSEIPVTAVISGQTQRDTLKGKINGGGTGLTLRASAGSIHIRRP